MVSMFLHTLYNVRMHTDKLTEEKGLLSEIMYMIVVHIHVQTYPLHTLKLQNPNNKPYLKDKLSFQKQKLTSHLE